MTDQLCQEAVEFFRSTPVYDRLLHAVKERYVQLGRIGGTVTLRNLSGQDQQDLAAFLGKSFLREEQVKIALQDFLKAFQIGRFREVTLSELLETYFAEQLITKAERQETWQKEWEELFYSLSAEYPHELCQRWLSELANRHGIGYRLIYRKFNEERERLDPTERLPDNVIDGLPEENRDRLQEAGTGLAENNARASLKADLGIVCKALTNLPVHEKKVVRLPIFASKITTDPHGFDAWTDRGKLFRSALATVFLEPLPRSGEEVTLLYQKAGILKGDIASYVTTYGLLAYRAAALHPLWQGALDADEILQVTLENLFCVDRVVSPGGRVYVLENPAVFSELVESVAGNQHAFICSSGQLSLASLVLLDHLAKEGVEIFYAGDFDPEGLGIAQRLIDRYPTNLVLWHYSIEDYRKALSEVDISETSLSKLGKIENGHLAAIQDEMLRLKKAGYQELLLEEMVREIRVG